MNTPRHFDRLTRLSHWLMAALLIAMLFIGAGMVTALSLRPWLMDLHCPPGITIGALVLVRFGNRLSRPAPSLSADLPRWQVAAAHASHVLLYVLMLSLPLIGWAVLSTGDFPVMLSRDVSLPAIGPTDPVAYARLRLAHVALAVLLFAVVVMHACAALYHAWIRRDGFASMAQGPRQSAQSSR